MTSRWRARAVVVALLALLAACGRGENEGEVDVEGGGAEEGGTEEVTGSPEDDQEEEDEDDGY